jgi:hypothetical protein
LNDKTTFSTGCVLIYSIRYVNVNINITLVVLFWILGKIMNIKLLAISVLFLFLVGCSSNGYSTDPKVSEPVQPPHNSTITLEVAVPTLPPPASPTETEAPVLLPTLMPTLTATPFPTPEKIGPDEFPPGFSPLSGLQVKNPATLDYPPIMVSVSNFPPSARPPAGLDWSPVVMEAYIGDGETRFLANFYGDYPSIGSSTSPAAYPKSESPYNLTSNNFANSIKPLVVGDGAVHAEPTLLPPSEIPVLPDSRTLDGPGAGPVRSARVWYGEAATLNHAKLAFCHAWEGVLKQLSNDYITVNPSNDNDINSAFIDVTKLEAYAQNAPLQLQPGDLTGNLYDTNLPGDGLAQESGSVLPVSYQPNLISAQSSEGTSANTVWIPWSNLSQIIWRYDPQSGAYNRYQDQADAKTFVKSIDRLNGAPLTYENLIILFANHIKMANYVYEIELMYVQKFPAILFRDGKKYNIYWTSASSEYEKKTGRARPIRYIDENGNPFPLKPGQTWVTIMPAGVQFDVHEIPPFDFDSKQAVRNLKVNFGKPASNGMESATYQEKIFFATDMDSRYPQRFSIKAEGSGTWIVPFSEASIQSP